MKFLVLSLNTSLQHAHRKMNQCSNVTIVFVFAGPRLTLRILNKNKQQANAQAIQKNKQIKQQKQNIKSKHTKPQMKSKGQKCKSKKQQNN